MGPWKALDLSCLEVPPWAAWGLGASGTQTDTHTTHTPWRTRTRTRTQTMSDIDPSQPPSGGASVPEVIILKDPQSCVKQFVFRRLFRGHGSSFR